MKVSERWRDDAVCTTVDPELFFPEKGGSNVKAKRVCRQCPVQVPCLEFALGHDMHDGIWGGLSGQERRRVRRGAA